MKNRIQMGISTGGPTIIMIFVVLCLATLGTLSLVTANADMKLTVKTLDNIQAYYTADCRGEEFLSQVDAALLAARNDQNKGSFLASAKNALEDIPGISIEQKDENAILISYTIGINDKQSLFIRLSAADSPADPAKRYSIESWKVVSDDYWNYEEYDIEFEDIIIPE